MALKSKITAAEHAALNDVLKAEYKANGADFVLDTDDRDELVTARDKEKKRADDAVAEAARLKKIADDAAAATAEAVAEAARKSGDVTSLDASWTAKLDTQKAEDKKKLDAANKAIEDILVDSVAAQIAAEISTVPALFKPIIAARLHAEVDPAGVNKPITRVLGADGKASALSLEDLKKELLANTEYSGIIKGTSANGGGANNSQPGGGALGGKKFSQLTETERTALHRENPTKFNDLSARSKKGEDVTV